MASANRDPGTEPGTARPARSWRTDGVPPMVVATVLSAAVVLGLTAASVAALIGDTWRDAGPVVVGAARPTEKAGTAPAIRVQGVHMALHDIGDWCIPQTDADARRRLRRDTDVILSFARRYPTARFRIDDETGSVLSLLLVARNELRACSSADAARVDRALPPGVRNGLVPLAPAAD